MSNSTEAFKPTNLSKQHKVVYDTIAKRDFNSCRKQLLKDVKKQHPDMGFQPIMLDKILSDLKRGGYIIETSVDREIFVTSQAITNDDITADFFRNKEVLQKSIPAKSVVKDRELMEEPSVIGGAWQTTPSGDQLLQEMLSIKDKIADYEAMVAMNPALSVTDSIPNKRCSSRGE